jgi:hypothetical protein
MPIGIDEFVTASDNNASKIRGEVGGPLPGAARWTTTAGAVALTTPPNQIAVVASSLTMSTVRPSCRCSALELSDLGLARKESRSLNSFGGHPGAIVLKVEHIPAAHKSRVDAWRPVRYDISR